MIYVDIDLETKSLCDLKLSGAERYSEDFSTEVICASYRIADDLHAPYHWIPGDKPGYFEELVSNPDTIWVAHNAAFEQAIWRNVMVKQHGFPELPINRWDCTLACCAWKGLPLSLDKAGRALRLNIVKDKEGNALTMSLSGRGVGGKLTKEFKQTGTLPVVTPSILERVLLYCDRDVEVEHGIEKRIGLISRQSKAERRIWVLDQTINQRGVRLDLGFVQAAQRVVDLAVDPLRKEFFKLTGIKKVTSPVLKDWCQGQGVELENLQKGYLAELLGSDEDDGSADAGYLSLSNAPDVTADDEARSNQDLSQISIPDSVRRVLRIRQMLGGAAVKKLPRMLACVGYDGRARGLVQYHAAHSGRWGGRLLQPQNFPREPSGLPPEDAVAAILSGDPGVVERAFRLPALEAVAKCLRHALVPDPGKVFLVGDYTQIEARIILALAGQRDKCKLLEDGYPVYFDMAEQIYSKPKGHWTNDLEAKKKFSAEYTIGKNTILGCGFQMGPEKFHNRYCPTQPIEFAERVVETYRKEWAPKVPYVWYAQDEASFKAVEQWRATESYGVTWKPDGEFLTATLPSGWQKLWYPFPHLGTGKFGDPCWKSMQSKQGKWVSVDMYGGLETENVVQALARGLLCAAIDRLERAGLPVVLTVHDEILIEVDENKADMVQFEKLMMEPTRWAADMGIPINVESWQGTRYKK